MTEFEKTPPRRNRSLQREARAIQKELNVKYTVALRIAKDIREGMTREEAINKNGV